MVKTRNTGNEGELAVSSRDGTPSNSIKSPETVKDSPKVKAPNNDISILRVSGLVFFFLVYGFVFSLIGLYVLPLEANALFPADPSSALSIMFILTGGPMLLGPLFGKVSDESKFKMGRRRPFIIIGTAVSSFALVGMSSASYANMGNLYLLFLLFTMVFLQLITNAQHALLPDFVPKHRQGEISGMVAIMELLGSSLGFVYIFLFYDAPIETAYVVFITLLLASLPISCFAANEIPGTQSLEWKSPSDSETGALMRDDGTYDQGYSEVPARELSTRNTFCGIPILSLREIIYCYYLDWGPRNRDFNFVFISRFLYNLAISVQIFFLYFIRDMAGAKTENEQKIYMAACALTAQCVAASIALPMGKVSDLFGRKYLIYLSASIMCATYFLFSVHDFQSYPGPLASLIIIGVIYGIGNGSFLAVDTALALDVLPDKEEAAKAMGIWTTSGFLSVMLGPTLWFLCMKYGGKSPEGHYNALGYQIMMAAASLCVIGAAVAVSSVKRSHKGTYWKNIGSQVEDTYE